MVELGLYKTSFYQSNFLKLNTIYKLSSLEMYQIYDILEMTLPDTADWAKE